MSEAFALHSMFEGLFVRALKVEEPLTTRLRECGFDLANPKPRYPMRVWEQCIDATIVAQQLGPTREAAWVEMGRRFIDGYFQTLVGKFISTSLPFLNTKSFMPRVPRFMTTGLDGVAISMVWNSPREATLTILGPGYIAGSFMSGILAVCFERMKVQPVSFTARPLNEHDSELVITLPG